jgi:hypothetical protein
MRRAWLLCLVLTGCKLRIGVHDRPKLLGKTADVYVSEAKSAMDGGDWMTASVLLSFASKLSQSDVLASTYRDSARQLADQIATQARGSFPMHVASDPPVDLYSFMGIVIEKDPEIMPKINYVHPANVSDGPRLRALAEQLHAQLLPRFPGLRTRFRHVLYTGFSEPPSDPKRSYERFGTVIDTATGRAGK